MPKTPEKPPLCLVSPETIGLSPPRKLGPAGTQFWNAVQHEYRIVDRGGVEILAQICAAQDRIADLQAAIDRDGPIIYVRGVAKSHPGLRDEIQLRAFVCRAIEKLGLSFEAVKPPGRPTKPFGWVPE